MKKFLATTLGFLGVVGFAQASAPVAHSAGAHPANKMVPAATASVLYDQMDAPSGSYVSSQDFEAARDTYDDQAADDFVVPEGQTWGVTGVDVVGYLDPVTDAVPASFNVYFHENALNTAAAPSFAAQLMFDTGTNPISVSTADINGDGLPDLLVANLSGTVSVLLNTTAPGAAIPSFADQQTFAAGTSPYSVAAADINGDGLPDVILANQGSGTVSVLLNTTAAGATTPVFAAQQTFATGAGPYSVSTADINGDGTPDLLVSNSGTNTVSVLLNTTAPGATTVNFAAQQAFTVGSGPMGNTSADVNGDGLPDLIVAIQGTNGVTVLLNTTAPGASVPSFAPQQNFSAGLYPGSVAAADVNGDGLPDMVVANQGGNTASVLLNTTAPGATTPSFTAQQVFATGSGPFVVTATDVNGDGLPDFAFADADNTASVLLNTTPPGAMTASFTTQQSFGAGVTPFSIAAADINSDGQPDLVVANLSGNNVSVLLNTTAPATNLPGALVASALDQSYTGGAASGDIASITLATPISLPPGTYWVSVQAREDYTGGGEWFWGNRTTQSNSAAAWQNPGDALATGCTTWGIKTTCLGASQVGADQLFRLKGTGGAMTAPTIAKVFVPASVEVEVASTLTITLGNDNDAAATLSADLVDTFPAGLVVAATPNAATTCMGGVGVTTTDGSVTLGSGAQIPAGLTCTISVDVISTTAGSYTNSIAVGALQTDAGSNTVSADATLTVTPAPVLPPTVAKSFTPASVAINTDSTAIITLANANATAATLSAELVDTLPTGLVASAAVTTCGGSVSFTAASVTLAAGATIPANGSCTLTATVQSASAGNYVNTIAAGALQTDQGANAAAASATLNVTSTAALYDQMDASSGTYVSSQDFEAARDTYDDQAADDFVVPEGQAWNIAGINVVGYLDSATGAVPASFNVYFHENALSAASNASFADQQTFGAGTNPDSVATADVNADGLPDLLVTNLGDNTVSVLLNTTTLGATTPSFAAQQTFATGTHPFSVAAADINSDGAPDLIVANRGDNTVSVRLNTTAAGATSASFAAQEPFATGAGPYGVSTADVNGDGKPDLMVVNIDDDTVSVLLNTTVQESGTPSFAPQQVFDVGRGPMSVVAADVNSDGLPDLIVANQGSFTVSVLLNTTTSGAATASFTEQQAFATGQYPGIVAAADINGDGKPDLITANQTVDTLSVLINTTPPGAMTPSFAVQQTFAGGSGPYSVIAVDVNGDGKPDLLASDDFTNTVSVLLNTTTPGAAIPTFAVPQTFITGAVPFSLAAADVNGDDIPDLIAANLNDNNVSVLLNTTAPATNLPGTLVASALDQSYTGGAASGDIASIMLATPVSLPPGTYWVSVQAREDYTGGGEWFWGNRSTQSNGAAAWQNPGNALNTGCTTWGVKTTCLGASQVGADQLFSLNGTSRVVVAPTVAKSFAPTSVEITTDSTATITLGNANAMVAVLSADLVDTLPTGLVASAVATTCGGSASFTTGSVTLASGGTIPANSSCTITATVQAATVGSYVNTIAAGALQTDQGANTVAASAQLTVTPGPGAPVAVVTPSALTFSVETGASESTPLTIGNTGGTDLTWAIQEAAASVRFNLHSGKTHASATTLHSMYSSGVAMPAASKQSSWTPFTPNGAVPYVLDDGGYETTLGFGSSGPPATESAAIWLNRFTPAAGTGAFTVNSISITWPDNAAGSMVGLQARLLAYYDPDGDGNPANAILLGQSTITIGALNEFETYPVSFNVPGAGDIYIGFEDVWAEAGGYTPRLYPAALDTNASQDRSFLLGMITGTAPDIDNLANNNFGGTVDSLGQPGNFLVRATGSAGSGVACTSPTDVPWLSETPTSGTVIPGSTVAVTVSVDASGLDAGAYSANLCVGTNDPYQPIITVPVSMTVTANANEGIFRDGFDGSGTRPEDIVDSGPINLDLPETFDGVYLDWIGGRHCTDTNCGGNLNAYDDDEGLAFFWGEGTSGAGGVDSNGVSYAILTSGMVVGPSSHFIANTNAVNYTNWRAGADGNLGFTFQCSSPEAPSLLMCYGYAHLITSAGTGFPARVVEYWYDKSGAAITIP